MATVKLDWTVPTATDIEHVRVFRFDGDYTALAAADATLDLSTTDGADGRLLDAANAAKFVAAGAQLVEQPYADGNGTYDDASAEIGQTYVYGVFSHNSGGYGPGELELQAV